MEELPKQAIREQSKEETKALLELLLPKGETLTKNHLAEVVFEQYGLPKRFCKDIVELFFQNALDCLVRGEDLKLSNFGVFSLKKKVPAPAEIRSPVLLRLLRLVVLLRSIRAAPFVMRW